MPAVYLHYRNSPNCPREYNGIMPLVIEDTWLPATLTAPPMTDEEFAAFCSEHPDLSFKTTASGELIVTPPAFTEDGFRNAEIGAQLYMWAKADGRGRAADSSTGYVLPNSARRSSDALWVLKTRIRELDRYSQDHFYHLGPDFVIEPRSDSDRLPVLRDKILEWIANGAQLGWLIDPSRRAVEIFRPDCESEIREDAIRIEGEGPVAGFVLDLSPVWEDPSD